MLGDIMSVEVRQDFVRLRKNAVIVPEHRNVILPGDLIYLLAEGPDIRDDDVLVGEAQFGQLLSYYFAFRAPMHMIQC
jgi:hypothetical protein